MPQYEYDVAELYRDELHWNQEKFIEHGIQMNAYHKILFNTHNTEKILQLCLGQSFDEYEQQFIDSVGSYYQRNKQITRKQLSCLVSYWLDSLVDE